MALEKGTEEWMFWSDFFQYCKKNWTVKDCDDYWKSLIQESELLYQKYKTNLAKEFILAFLKVKSNEYKLINQ